MGARRRPSGNSELIAATGRDNSYATHDIADADKVVKLPPELADQPFPGEPLGCAFNIFRRADIQASQTVAIVGIGFSCASIVPCCRPM